MLLIHVSNRISSHISRQGYRRVIFSFDALDILEPLSMSRLRAGKSPSYDILSGAGSNPWIVPVGPSGVNILTLSETPQKITVPLSVFGDHRDDPMVFTSANAAIVVNRQLLLIVDVRSERLSLNFKDDVVTIPTQKTFALLAASLLDVMSVVV